MSPKLSLYSLSMSMYPYAHTTLPVSGDIFVTSV